jgi:hypothetical protein
MSDDQAKKKFQHASLLSFFERFKPARQVVYLSAMIH